MNKLEKIKELLNKKALNCKVKESIKDKIKAYENKQSINK